MDTLFISSLNKFLLHVFHFITKFEVNFIFSGRDEIRSRGSEIVLTRREPRERDERGRTGTGRRGS